MAERIVFFDGVCNLCDSAVQFIIRHDAKKKFKFASLQSEYAQKTIPQFVADPNFQSIVFKDGNHVFLRSTAALRIARQLDWPFPIFFVLIIIPPFLRNFVYRFIAKNRYRWFGKKESCMLPSSELKDRFLD